MSLSGCAVKLMQTHVCASRGPPMMPPGAAPPDATLHAPARYFQGPSMYSQSLSASQRSTKSGVLGAHREASGQEPAKARFSVSGICLFVAELHAEPDVTGALFSAHRAMRCDIANVSSLPSVLDLKRCCPQVSVPVALLHVSLALHLPLSSLSDSLVCLVSSLARFNSSSVCFFWCTSFLLSFSASWVTSLPVPSFSCCIFLSVAFRERSQQESYTAFDEFGLTSQESQSQTQNTQDFHCVIRGLGTII